MHIQVFFSIMVSPLMIELPGLRAIITLGPLQGHAGATRGRPAPVTSPSDLSA